MACNMPVPFWLVWNGNSQEPQTDRHTVKSDAEAAARRLARSNPGRTFYVLAPLSSFTVGKEVIERFDRDEIPPDHQGSRDAEK